MIQAQFYEAENGRKPLREWLLGLIEHARRVIGYDIHTVEFDWPIGIPTCRSLGGGLWEVRSDLLNGKIGRVIFCIMNGDMILLHGFMKKTQKTPMQDIDFAIKRKKEIE